MGRRLGLFAAFLTTIAYSGLVHLSIARGAPLEWREELWSLSVFLLVAFAMISEHGHLNDRLARIVGVFSRAGRGDFSQAYDEEADEALYTAKRSGRDRARLWSPAAPAQLELGVSA